MGKQFFYNYEKYSLDEIKHFIESEGYSVQFFKRLYGGGAGYLIRDLLITISQGEDNFLKRKQKGDIYVAPRVYFEPRGYFYQMRRGDRTVSNTWDDVQKEIKKYNNTFKDKADGFFAKLKRKFAIKKGESPQSIKDAEKMDIKDYSQNKKKSWWPFS